MSSGYWHESVSQALCEIAPDAYRAMTEEQLDSLADALAGCAENESTYTGRDVISTPPDPDIDRLRSEVRRLEETLARTERQWTEAYARAAGTRSEGLYMNQYGRVERMR